MKDTMKNSRKALSGEHLELLDAYRIQLAKAFGRDERINRKELVKRALQQGARRYHVSFGYAYQIVTQLRKHTLIVKSTARRRMWQGLLNQLDAEMKKNRSITIEQALARVLLVCRPVCFRVSEPYAYKLIYKLQYAEKRNSRCVA